MEASGNEYVQQLLDRAANLIRATADGEDTDEQLHREWLAEYQREKARFGQPEGSPAYAETRGFDGSETRGTDVNDAVPEDYDGRYDRLSVAELSAQAESRGLAKSGTKAELINRLHQDDLGANAY